ncbi:cupin domain-containing protein [Sphingomonas colocasiae]|uniref:CDGSH iron-sulfur domain-containing protein n=1 Tax=Sphingomonas colocasiae TaxID=1848973 RepID=A0ABS7PUZ6_9SPHN|nr:cupin domain-containing protein [Sphingomonas colocasiae]MBY8824764.1 CDGSH iron-sulfur domain-containing protein [Sphingomonas colocasiae]
MGEAVVASRKPFYKELKAGRSYLWCACGRSKRQPFCDGRSHDGTGIEPIRYDCTVDGEEVLFCGCKQTATGPFCDGAHSNLPGGYAEEAELAEDLPWAESDAAGVRSLDGHCYVIAAEATRPDAGGGWWCRTIVSSAMGARHQAQFYGELRHGQSPVLASPAGDVVLWTMAGQGSVEISGRTFALAKNMGVYVRGGEAFRFTQQGEDSLGVHIHACPATDMLDELAAMPADFDANWPDRTVGVDESQRHAMGPRYFQMLVDKRIGSTTATQFIGHIPQSRAEMHRHLYEEALIILSGEGVIWNDGIRARVRGGDVIFFPRKHRHSLQCTHPDGMDVVGLIHPGDNPGINY